MLLMDPRIFDNYRVKCEKLITDIKNFPAPKHLTNYYPSPNLQPVGAHFEGEIQHNHEKKGKVRI